MSLAATTSATTIIDVLHQRARACPRRIAFHRLHDRHEDHMLTFAGLRVRARRLAVALSEMAPAGARVLLCYPSSLEFVVAFLGCLEAGLIPVPLSAGAGAGEYARLRAVAEDCAPVLLLSTPDTAARLADGLRDLADAFPFRSEDALVGAPDRQAEAGGALPVVLHAAAPDDLAFLQYTSGSTGDPKGVQITHRNLLTNLCQIAAAVGTPEGVPIVSWLPQFHDMGLIGGMLFPIWIGGTVHFMSPAEFVQRPVRWLRAMSRYQAFGSVAPNFGYAYAAERIRDRELEGIDLSRLRALLCGAEPIRAATLQRFQSRFARYGLREDVYLPCYGLAEATLFVTGGPGMGSVKLYQSRGEDDSAAASLLTGTAAHAPVVGCGRPAEGVQVSIVDPESGRVLPAGHTGEICIAGENVTPGYWGEARRRGRAPAGAGLPTGDLGFIKDGELYVTGRLKDLIIFRGRNVHPQDVEMLSEGLTPGAGVGTAGAVSTTDGDGQPAIWVVQEVRPRQVDAASAEAYRQRIAAGIAEHHGIPRANVVFVRANSIPRTTSGKISRTALKAKLVAGALRDLFTLPAPTEPTPEVTQ